MTSCIHNIATVPATLSPYKSRSASLLIGPAGFCAEKRRSISKPFNNSYNGSFDKILVGRSISVNTASSGKFLAANKVARP